MITDAALQVAAKEASLALAETLDVYKRQAQANADAMQLLLRHVNHRISAYLKSVYPLSLIHIFRGLHTGCAVDGQRSRRTLHQL